MNCACDCGHEEKERGGGGVKRLAIAIAIAIGVFAIGIVWQEVFFPGSCRCEPLNLHLRWHVREVITALVGLASGALYIAVSGLVRKGGGSRERDQGE
jgi:hypothetical protein